jgi:chromosome segregation ATPase
MGKGLRMIRKILIGLLLLAGCFYLVKKTSLVSYAGTLWCQVQKETKNQVPTKFEIDRVRHELAGMDGDITKMLRPIAEHMAAVERLKKEIKTARADLADQKTSILTMTKDLEGNPSVVAYGGEEYSASRIRRKLQRDFAAYKRCEAHLKSREKLLEAKEQSLAAAREQLSKLVAKKREYEVRLAQYEAEEETLQIARIGSKLPLDDNRASEIERALAEIEQRQEVQRAEVELLSGPLANDFIPVQQRTKTGANADLDEIRGYFENQNGGPTAKAATK